MTIGDRYFEESNKSIYHKTLELMERHSELKIAQEQDMISKLKKKIQDQDSLIASLRGEINHLVRRNNELANRYYDLLGSHKEALGIDK